METPVVKDMLNCDKPSSLIIKTKELLTNDARSLLEIHRASGIPFYWLQKFSSKHFDNPSVNRVQYLYEFLTNSQLTF